MKKVEYYFDFLSPYSYFSFISLKNKDFFNNYDVELKPVVMGSLFNHFEMKGPGMIRPKRQYMLKQCFIYAAINNISFTPPDKHPFNPLYALRLATKSCSKERQLEIIEALFTACWGRGLTLGEPEELSPILQESGFDAQTLIDLTFNKEVKKELKQNIKDAISSDIFGVPSFKVQDEIFWGNDSINQMELFLSNDFPNWNRELYKYKIDNDSFEG
jgi:2-hydroxychromene-2-carboxylate isomerase